MKLVKESLIEGTGDKYFYNKNPAQVDDFAEFEKIYQAQQMEKKQHNNNGQDKIIYRKDRVYPNGLKWNIIKNPSSIKSLGPGVRGVIAPSGDVYFENFSGKHIHNDILPILYDLGELDGTFKPGWGKKLPQVSGFLTVQRFKDTPYIAIGESNKDIYDEDNYDNLVGEYDKFLKTAKQKNPNLSFSNKLVGIKTFKRKTNDENGIIVSKNKMSESLMDSISKQKNLIANWL